MYRKLKSIKLLSDVSGINYNTLWDRLHEYKIIKKRKKYGSNRGRIKKENRDSPVNA